MGRVKETANATAEQPGQPMQDGGRQTVLAPVEPGFTPYDSRPSYMKRKWPPYTTTEELPPATYARKQRFRTLIDGTVEKYHETVCIKPGDGRYKVSNNNELIKIYRKHGGVGTKLIHKFKVFAGDSKEAKQMTQFNKDFRRYLKTVGVPGA